MIVFKWKNDILINLSQSVIVLLNFNVARNMWNKALWWSYRVVFLFVSSVSSVALWLFLQVNIWNKH